MRPVMIGEFEDYALLREFAHAGHGLIPVPALQVDQLRKLSGLVPIGTVDEVMDFDCPVTNTEGAHVVLRTADARIMVHIAPVSFLKQFGIELKKGEKLQVIGARMKDGEGGDTIIAREITSNEVVLGVRTPDGKPLW